MMIFRRIAIVTLLLLMMTGLATSVAGAAGQCVHPTGAGNCFTSIQAAVDAAQDGDHIIIRKGKYSEQVSIIGKNLTLIGQSGAVVEAPLGMQDTLSAVAGIEGRPVILVAGADVTIRNLTINGRNSAEQNPFLDGITFISAGGVIRDNTVMNMGFGEPRLPLIDGYPSYQGNGIVVANQMPTPRSIVISGNRLMKFNSVGITVFAETDPENPAESTLTANIVDNIITAQGRNDVIDQWGIFLGGYNFAAPQLSVTGVIEGNQIRDALTTAPHPLPGIGIVTLYTHDVQIADNVIENVNLGMAANLAFTTAITGNRVNGSKTPEPGSMGLILSGSDSYVAENHLKRLELGIMLMVEDPTFGSATNTALDENRFESVGVDLLTGAGSSMTMTALSLQAEAAPVEVTRRFGPR